MDLFILCYTRRLMRKWEYLNNYVISWREIQTRAVILVKSVSQQLKLDQKQFSQL